MTTAAQQLLLVLATSSMVFDTPCWQVIHSPWVPGNRLACGVRQLFWLLVVDKGEEVAPLSILSWGYKTKSDLTKYLKYLPP